MLSTALSSPAMPRFQEPEERKNTGPDSFEYEIDISISQNGVELFPLYDYRAEVTEEDGGYVIGALSVGRYASENGKAVKRWTELDESTATGAFVAALIRKHYDTQHGQMALFERQMECSE